MVLNAEIKNNQLHLTVALEKIVEVSKSGKTKVVASTHGFQSIPVMIEQLPVSISLNAIIPNNGGKSERKIAK